MNLNSYSYKTEWNASQTLPPPLREGHRLPPAWPSPPPESHSGRFFVLTLNCRLASIRIRTKTDRLEQV